MSSVQNLIRCYHSGIGDFKKKIFSSLFIIIVRYIKNLFITWLSKFLMINCTTCLKPQSVLVHPGKRSLEPSFGQSISCFDAEPAR